MKSNALYATIIFIFCSQVVLAIDYPRIEPYVNDFANVLSDSEELVLNNLADAIEKNLTVEIAIVSVLTTQGEDRVLFANRIGDVNGVGKKDADNGIIILYSLDNERGGAIAVGRGIESVLNDAKVGRIGREHRPLFDEGNFAAGYTAIITDIQKELVDYTSTPSQRIEEVDAGGWTMTGLFIGAVILVFFLSRNKFTSSDFSRTGFSMSVGSSSHSSYRGSSFSGGSFGGGGAGF